MGLGRAALMAAAMTVALVVATPRVDAAELLMFEERGCPWCQRWHEEVGVGYPKSPEGQRAPLRRLELGEARAVKVKLAAPVTVSPTFVLIDSGREVGRITGYPGAAFFWGLFIDLLAKVDRETH